MFIKIKNVGKYKLGWKRHIVASCRGTRCRRGRKITSSINSLYVNFPLNNNVKYLQCCKNKGRSNRRQKIMWEQRECIKRNLHVYKGKKEPDSNLALHSHWLADTEQKQAVSRTRGLIYSVKQKHTITLNTQPTKAIFLQL